MQYIEMKNIKLEKLGKSIGQLALGAGPFGGIYGGTDVDECSRTLKKAIDSSVNYIDTAPWYGQGASEEMLGRFLPSYPRDSFVIATKVGRYDTDPKKMFDFSAEKTLASVDESLKKLGLDYVDIIQVHDVEFAPNLDIILNETLPALEQVVKSGKAKMIGVTGYPIEPLNELIEKSRVKIDMVLCYTRGSMADQKLNQFLPGWKEKNIFVVNASPLGMGLFRRGGPQPWHPANDDLKEEIKKCISLCEEKNIDISRLALRYALDSIHADIVLCGTAKTVELDENIKNTLNSLTAEEQAVQDEILSRLAKLQGHWEGRELIAYNNRINDVEDDLPFFR